MLELRFVLLFESCVDDCLGVVELSFFCSIPFEFKYADDNEI